MRISRTAQWLRGRGIVFHVPKTHRSNRPVALSADTLLVLRDHRRIQLEHRVAAGPAYGDQGLVFARATGEPLDGSCVTKGFQRLAVEIGLGHVRFHDLRHSAATLLLAAGVNPKAVAERLGHSSVAFVLTRVA